MPNLKLSPNRSQTLTSANKLIRVISDMKQSEIAVITGRLQPTYLIVDYCFDNYSSPISLGIFKLGGTFSQTYLGVNCAPEVIATVL